MPAGVDWVDLGPELEDFSDTAAVISQLDLVICVDTAVAHLAGALGKPVWVMVAQPADFRWLEGREDSPWYPTMRLFRQSRRDDWSDVVAAGEGGAGGTGAGRAGGDAGEDEREGGARALRCRGPAPAQLKAGHRPGLSAVAETRVGILQYLPDEPIVGDAIGWYGEYLQPQLDLLARIVRPGSTMLEVGAGVGAHAVFLGRMLGEAGHLFLYESRPVLQRIMRQNLAANGVGNVTVMRRALGSRGEEDSGRSRRAKRWTNCSWSGWTGSRSMRVLLRWTCLPGRARRCGGCGRCCSWRRRTSRGCARWRSRRANSAIAAGGWRRRCSIRRISIVARRTSLPARKALALLAIPEEIDVDIALDECIEIS